MQVDALAHPRETRGFQPDERSRKFTQGVSLHRFDPLFYFWTFIRPPLEYVSKSHIQLLWELLTL